MLSMLAAETLQAVIREIQQSREEQSQRETELMTL